MMTMLGAPIGPEKMKRRQSQRRGHGPEPVKTAGLVGLGKSLVNVAVENHKLLLSIVQLQ
jgi:hypothetical protein